MFQFLIHVIVLAFSIAFCDITEPKCLSQFDYEHKLIYKLIKIEEEVKNFRIFIDELKNTQKQIEIEQKQKLDETLAKFNEDVGKELSELPAFRKEMTELLNQFKTSSEAHLQESKEKGDDVLKQMKETFNNSIAFAQAKHGKTSKGPAIGFSVMDPKDASKSITFTTVVTNQGSGYDTGTGVFTCTVPGYYYFSLMLLKSYNYTSRVRCAINKDGILVYAYTQPYSSSGPGGHLSTTNSVFVHLTTGDNISLSDCTSASTLTHLSSFTGFLVTPDA